MKLRRGGLTTLLVLLIGSVVVASEVTQDKSSVTGGVHTVEGQAKIDTGHTFIGLTYYVKDSADTVIPGYINLPKGPPKAGGSAPYTGTSKTLTKGTYKFYVEMSYSDGTDKKVSKLQGTFEVK